jgi:hypothetical protein
MMRHKVAELEGALLDAAVALLDKREKAHRSDGLVARYLEEGSGVWKYWRPSTDWVIGGPIIERERIGLEPPPPSGGTWMAYFLGDPQPQSYHPVEDGMYCNCHGATPLIAAMRAYVFNKLGSEIAL